MSDEEKKLWHAVFITLAAISGIYVNDAIRWANEAVDAYRVKNAGS